MIDDQVFASARRLYFAEHLTVATIAGQLGVHRDAVRRAIGADAFNQRKVVPARPSLLDPFQSWSEILEKSSPRSRGRDASRRAREQLKP